MEESKFFTNVITTTATIKQLKTILRDGQQLKKWIPEISSVTQQDESYHLIRHTAAINHHEKLTIQEIDDRIIYVSTQDQIEYRLLFTLTNQQLLTLIQEDLYISKSASSLKVVQPILQQAFAENLRNLIVVAREVA